MASIAGACGKESTGEGGAPIGHPTSAGEVVVQVLVDGGFVPLEVALATVTPAPTLAIYPGPAPARHPAPASTE